MMFQYLDDALSACEALVNESVPSGPTDWMNACQTVGNILSGMGFPEDSYSWQTMALDVEPNVLKFYAASGSAYSRCQAWPKAAYFCERLIEHQPDNADAYCRLAEIYNQMGDYKAESETLHALLGHRPDKADAEGHYQLGKVIESHGLYEQAIQCYEQAIEQDPDFVVAYYSLSELWVKQGQPQSSIHLLQRLTQHLTDDATAHYRLGRAYRQNKQYETAILSFRQALQLDPDLHWAYIGLLNSLLQLKRWDETIESCRGILHFVGQFPWVYCFLGNALAHKGDFAEAAKSHQQAFELRGWERCRQQGYQFTQTWFSESISLWERYLLPLNQPTVSTSATSPGARRPLRILSLGSRDGSSLCWLVDEILREPDDRLLCMTEGASNQLQQNLAKLPEANKVILKTGEPQSLLNALVADDADNQVTPDGGPDHLFDVIYIQSDCKRGDYLNALATQSWSILRPQGLMFFKDYQWQDPKDPSQSSRVGIDAFIQSVASQVGVLHRTHQVILKKEGKLDA